MQMMELMLAEVLLSEQMESLSQNPPVLEPKALGLPDSADEQGEGIWGTFGMSRS